MLAKQAVRDNKSPEQVLSILVGHYQPLAQQYVGSLLYSKMILEEEVEKGTVPQAYLDCVSKLLQSYHENLAEAVFRAIQEKQTNAERQPA
jgi:hypothetical protein